MPQPKRKAPKQTPSPTMTDPGDIDLTPADREAMEQQILAMGRLMTGQDFTSREDEQAFLEEMLVMAGDIPLLQDPAGFTVDPALEEAQDMIYEAMTTESQRKRIQLAKRALKVSPNCADAWVLLAQETAQGPEQARDFYEKGLRAGERALGEAPFTEDVGLFWGILETRPYMRARHGLALALWALGQHDEAIAHYQAMLELNPGDNQGIRYLLLPALLAKGTDEAIGDLLAGYEDDGSAGWVYGKALWRFRTGGAGHEANADLTAAIAANPFVPPFLTGAKDLPAEYPAFIGLGDEREADAYVIENISGWLRTPGAIDWLRHHAATQAAD